MPFSLNPWICWHLTPFCNEVSDSDRKSPAFGDFRPHWRLKSDNELVKFSQPSWREDCDYAHLRNEGTEAQSFSGLAKGYTASRAEPGPQRKTCK